MPTATDELVVQIRIKSFNTYRYKTPIWLSRKCMDINKFPPSRSGGMR